MNNQIPLQWIRITVRWVIVTIVVGLMVSCGSAHDEHSHDHTGHNHSKETKSSEHNDHDEHHHDDEHENDLKIDIATMQEFGIETAMVGSGIIRHAVRLHGEVVYNDDRIAHIRPTVAGVVRKVNFSVGDRVEAGQVLAILSSRELAMARSSYLATKARLELAQDNLERDRRLFEQKVGTERVMLESRQAFREAEIAMNQAENALHAMGYSHEDISKVDSLDDTDFNTYELTTPISGVVTQRHLTIGEVIEPASDSPFVIADLSTVWVDLSVYQRDMAHIKPGQRVEIQFGHGVPDASGMIAFISPALDVVTRTATARVLLDNPNNHWHPGLFITARIETGHDAASVVVPRSAITEIDGDDVVFVQTDAGFEPRSIQVGQTTSTKAEIVSGLNPGERYVSRNVLALKAEMNRAALEHAGHAH